MCVWGGGGDGAPTCISCVCVTHIAPLFSVALQCGTADADIKVPAVEKPELSTVFALEVLPEARI